MAKIREIKGRIKAVGNIQRITKTMQMIATARFQASQKRATGARPYTDKIAELVGELAAASSGQPGGLSHPLLRRPDPQPERRLVLVLSSNRGLCGGYNGNILRTAINYLKQNTGRQIDLEVVGKKAVGYFRFHKIPISTIHSQFGDRPALEDVRLLAENYIADYAAGKCDSVQVVYMTYQSVARQAPRVMQLLPLENPVKQQSDRARRGSPETQEGRSPQGQVDYEFTPDPAQLLAELLPESVKTQLFQCFNEAVASEQIARMVAMKAATDNATQMGKDLTRLFNRARQTAITTELSEIIGGSMGLE